MWHVKPGQPRKHRSWPEMATLDFRSQVELLNSCMSLDQPQVRPLPAVLRAAGIWLIWSTWCSTSGWLLSAVHQLDGYGYALLSPLLLLASWLWWKRAAPRQIGNCAGCGKIIRRLRHPAPLIYIAIVLLSLLGGLLYLPWSADATIYRLPRLLYWWQAHHWYWIDTLDHRLDFSSSGFEWQMLPIIMLTHTDRLLFLINWIPFLFLPGLVFVAFRALGVSGRTARRWMWLIPSAYSIALQSGSVQNDGYSVNFLLAAVAFAVYAMRRRHLGFALMSMLAAALLTGAKVSNLPLLLPLGVLVLAALGMVRWLNWKTAVVAVIALLCSFAPMSFLCWKQTGDWSGNPTDQWNVKTHGAAAALAANVTILLNDATQPPYFPGSQAVNARLQAFNQGPFIARLERAHGEFSGVHYGEMVYEGGAAYGFGLALYAIAILAGSLFVVARVPALPNPLPWAMRIAPWLAWISYLVLLVKLGSNHSARIATPYYPLLLVPLLRCPRIAAFEKTPWAGGLAVCCAATVLPIMLLTPARPLVPIQTLARITHRAALQKLADQYALWGGMRDNLAPLRAQFPKDATQMGYGGGFNSTPYPLFRPLGSRQITELGLPIGSGKLPARDLKYAVVTDDGIQSRYQMDLKTWLDQVGGHILFTYERNVVLDAHSPAKYESWYLVNLNPPPNRQTNTP